MKTPLLACLALTVLLSACGRGEPFDGSLPGNRTTERITTTPQQANLSGRYAFGPTVPKGFAGIPARLAVLTLKADGTLEMVFGSGCILDGATGTWGNGGFAVEKGAWTDERGQRFETARLVVHPVAATLLTPEGLRVEATMADGNRVAQFWDRQN